MSSPAQAIANAANAQNSTGPRTEDGKAKSAKNSLIFGLFSGDFIRPGEEDAYHALDVTIHCDLAPVGAMEELLGEEIVRAAWRLRRCGLVESHLVAASMDAENCFLDPMECRTADHFAKVQNSVDRARSQAHRLFHKAHAELRKLQAGRKSPESTPMKSAEPASTDFRLGSLCQPVGTPRNAACPCGSGQKHKRCCGKNAPPVLQFAA